MKLKRCWIFFQKFLMLKKMIFLIFQKQATYEKIYIQKSNIKM